MFICVFADASGFIGYSLAAGKLYMRNPITVAISWCTYSASAVFVAVLQLTEMQALVAYPVGLFCMISFVRVDDRLSICGDDGI